MKKFIIATLLLAGAGLAQADSLKLVNADGSALSELCIAAVSSRSDLSATAKALGITPLDTETLRCNGMRLGRFVGRYGNTVARKATAYFFSKADETAVTELCMAAVSSEQEYRKVMELHFSNDAEVEAEVRCNGIPLRRFARKYREPALTVSQR
jgi:hypothetical protein